MADLTTLRRSPLQHLYERLHAQRVDGNRGVALRELPFLTMVGVRVDRGSPAAARMGALLGVPLPEVCGTVASADGHHPDPAVLWLGPDEWLVVSATTDPEDLVTGLRDALAGERGAVVDVSANRTALELTGRAARETLEKSCPADLHPRSFRPGTAITTTLGP